MEPFIVEEVSDSSSVKVIIVWIGGSGSSVLKMENGVETIVINTEVETNSENFENMKFTLSNADLIFLVANLGGVTEIATLQLVRKMTKTFKIF